MRILGSRLFLLSLAVLLLNDFFLKDLFHNWLTGKISDFAGLFLFCLFWISLFPKFRKQATILTALLFIIWKSPFSQPFIDLWNGFALFSIGRVVDYSDLTALIVIPLAYRYSFANDVILTKKIAVSVVSVAAIFAFCATSISHHIDYDKGYSFEVSFDELINRMNHLDYECKNTKYSTQIDNADTFQCYGEDTTWFSYTGVDTFIDTMYNYKRHFITGKTKKTGIDTIYEYHYFDKDTIYIRAGDTIYYSIPECNCVSVQISISGNNNNSSVRLLGIEGRYCYGDNKDDKEEEKDKQRLLLAFERQFIEKLKADNQSD